jgi:hypothetical protein
MGQEVKKIILYLFLALILIDVGRVWMKNE